MEWLEHDDLDEEELPPWARQPVSALDGRPYAVRMYPEGVALVRGRSASAVRWSEILVPIRVDEPRRLLIAAARRPPHPPWFEIGGRDVAEIEDVVRTRLEAFEHGTYRERRRTRDPLPPDEVLTQVLAKNDLPGAVEIPAATPSVWKSALLGASVGGASLGLYGLAFGPWGLLAAATLGAVGGGGLLGTVEVVRKRSVGRVLVLTPDAFVGGLDGHSVRSIPWTRVHRFADGVTEQGEDALEVFGHDKSLIAQVAARYFGAPLDVIVAVAEAYRERALTG